MPMLLLMPTWWGNLIFDHATLEIPCYGWCAYIVMWHKQTMCWISMLLMQYNARLWWNSMMWWSYDDLCMVTLYWYSLVQSCVNDSCLGYNDIGYMNDCHARMRVTRCVIICRMLGLSMGFGRDVGKASTCSGFGGRVPWFMLPALCGIFMIVSIETGGPRIDRDPWLRVTNASVVTTSDARLQPIWILRGLFGQQPVPHREFLMSGPVCAAGVATNTISITWED